MKLLFVFLILIQFKHYLIDFVWQTNEMVQHKGLYGHPLGIAHSALHGVGTGFCLLFIAWFGIPVGIVLGMGLMLLDIVSHYHIDWAKMNYGNRDLYNPLFWNHLGLDQMAHHLIYLLIAAILFL